MGVKLLMEEKLRGLKNLKHNWYLIAGIIIEIRNAHDMNSARRIKEAADNCGYSANTLTRMASVRTFYDAVIKNNPGLKCSDPNTISFPSLEVVKRLYQEDPENGQKMFLKVVNGEITHRNLRQKYEQIKTAKAGFSSGYTARKEIIEFEQKAFDYIKSDSVLLFGDVTSLKYQSLLKSNLADMLVTSKTKLGLMNYGILFKQFYPDEKADRLECFVYKSIAHINFFDQYWFAFPSNSDTQKIKSFETILDAYEKISCGIILIPWGDNKPESLQILKYPTGKPVPDLRDKGDWFQNKLKTMRGL